MSGTRADLVRRLVGEEHARPHVRRRLETDNHLCRALLPIFDSSAGVFWTMAPASADEGRLAELMSGGLLETDWSLAVEVGGGTMVPTPNMLDVWAACVSGSLDPAHALCIVDQDPVRREPWVEEEGKCFFVDDDAYVLVSRATPPGRIEEALGELWIEQGLAAVCAPPRPYTKPELADPGELSQCARFVTEISVSAYDAEGFVAWTRR